MTKSGCHESKKIKILLSSGPAEATVMLLDGSIQDPTKNVEIKPDINCDNWIYSRAQKNSAP